MSRWYIIHAYSGFENKVRDAIQSEAIRLCLRKALSERAAFPAPPLPSARAVAISRPSHSSAKLG